MRSIRSQHSANARADRTPDFRVCLAPSARELEIRASCQRARDLRAARQRRQADNAKRIFLRLHLPAYTLCAIITAAAVIGGM